MDDRLDTILRAIPDPLFEVDEQWRVVDFHCAPACALAMVPAQFLGKSIFDVLPRAAGDVVRIAFTAAERDGLAVSAAYRLDSADGEKWREASIARANSPGPRGVRFVVLVRDITARVRAEQAAATEGQARLAKSEQRLAEAHRIAGLGAWERDVVTGELWWSEETYRLWGVAVGTPVSQARFVGMLHPDDRERYFAGSREVMTKGAWSGEFRITRGDGQIRHIHCFASRTDDADGRTIRVSGTNQDITERKRLDHQLQAGEKRYRRVFEEAVEGIFEVALDGTLLCVNKAFAQMLGYETPDELIGKNETALYADADARQERQATHGHADTMTGVEVVWRTKHGDRRVVELSGRAIRGEDGTTVGYHGIARDITTEHQREAAMRVLSTGVARLSGVQFFDELTSQLAQIVGADSAFVHKIVQGSPGWLSVVSRVIDGMLSPGPNVAVSGSPCEVVVSGHNLLIDKGVQQRFPDDQRLRAFGWEGYVAMPLRDARTRVIGTIGILSRRPVADTERLRSILELFCLRTAAELERERAEALFSGVFESAPDALIIVNAEGQIVQTNDASKTVFGYEREELLQLSLAALIPVEARSGHPRLMAQFFESGSSRKMGSPNSVVTAIRKDGARLHVDISLSRIHSDDGPMVVAAIRDVTAHRRLAEERERLAEQLQQRHRLEALGTLAGGIAHDLNNMLTPIVANVDLARESLREGDIAVAENLDAIAVASDRARKLVLQILTFGRRGHANQRAVTRVRSIVEEVVAMIRTSLPRGTDLVMHADGDGPSVVIDPTHLHQVLMNLVTNAQHAIHHETGLIGVDLDVVTINGDAPLPLTLVPGRYARIRVSDNGTGMDLSTRERIFDPFFTTKKTGKGTGLGLAVVDGIIGSNRGAITVESEVGRGTTFAVYFPATEERPRSTHPPAAPTEAPRNPSGRVLVIDDDAPVLQMTSALLKRAGHAVTSFLDAQTAVEAVRANPLAFDLVITDQNMPEMDGVTAAKAISALRRDLPIVLVSGNCEYTDDELARAGIHRFLAKPFSREQLSRVVEQALRSRAHP